MARYARDPNGVPIEEHWEEEPDLVFGDEDQELENEEYFAYYVKGVTAAEGQRIIAARPLVFGDQELLEATTAVREAGELKAFAGRENCPWCGVDWVLMDSYCRKRHLGDKYCRFRSIRVPKPDRTEDSNPF